MRRPENLKLKYFLEKMTLCDLWKLFSYVFLWSWRSKGSAVLKFERCEHGDDTFWKVWSVNYSLSSVLKDQVKKVPPLGGQIELCGGSSCLGSLRSLLNTVGILTLPLFLLGDGSLIWIWSASFAWWCKVLLSIIVKSLSSAFGHFVEMWWFLMALVVWFLWSETLSFRDLLVSPMYSAVQLLAGHFQW